MRPPLHKYSTFGILTLLSLSLLILVVSLSLGPGDLTLPQSWRALYETLFDLPVSDQLSQSLVWQIRLPRALLAFVIGAGLGCAGCISQGIFRNPLASPNVLGVSTGASVAVIIGVTLGLDELALWFTPLLAALGSVGTFGLLYLLTAGSRNIFSLLLSGLALSTLFSAIMALLLGLQVQDYEVTVRVMQWLLGSLEAKSWSHLHWGWLPILLGLMLSMLLRKDLDVLHLGEQTASSLGTNLRSTYLLSIMAVALLVGAATALAGIIGFVGLVIPHITRLLVGTSHHRLIPFSMALGAFFMLLVDITSRIIVSLYLPPGVITSLLGAPLFLWLIRKHYKGRQQ